jgi:hypothetical protein
MLFMNRAPQFAGAEAISEIPELRHRTAEVDLAVDA